MESSIRNTVTVDSSITDKLQLINDCLLKKKIKHVLFVCTANYQRSKTCEDLFSNLNSSLSFKSAGVSEKECKRRGSTLCTIEMLEKADVVFVFEPLHSERINQHTANCYNEKIINLKIEDKYQYMDSDLIELILSKLHLDTILSKIGRLKI